MKRRVRWLLLAIVAATPSLSALELGSPTGGVTARIQVGDGGRLTWSMTLDGRACVEPSALGILIGEVDLGLGVTLEPASVSSIDERYPWRGGKSMATHRCQSWVIPVRHGASGTLWQLEARVFDDGFAYRYRIPGKGTRRLRGERSSWTFPSGTPLWIQTNTGDYEGAYHRVMSDAIPATQRTDRGTNLVHLGPPVTAELPGGGYLLVTEAALFGYSGMTLKPRGDRRLEVVFEDDPNGFDLEDTVVTPWRVTVAARDLNALVNSDVVPNLCPAPDPKWFPEGMRTEWIKPGKALITWCVFGNEGAQWHLQKWFVDQCAALRCEYLLVDAGWRTERWGWLAGGGDVWARLKELCDYGATKGVGIVVWHAYPEGRDDGPGLTRPEARIELFRRCAEAGVKGVKIDFFNSERLEVVRVYEELARLAAEHRLLINYHGSHKPSGEVRTWPNEITREGIREQEYVLWDKLPLEHYAALPFTRMAVGHSDFLPTYVRSKYLRNTTAVFQMATAIFSTSSFVCWPDHPEDYRVSPFLGLIQVLPLVWDETRVLPGTSIGRLVGCKR